MERNVQSISRLVGKHQGASFLILAGGPSAGVCNRTQEQLARLALLVTIAVNLPPSWLLPDYWIRFDCYKGHRPDVGEQKLKYEKRFVDAIRQWADRDDKPIFVAKRGESFAGLWPKYDYDAGNGFRRSFGAGDDVLPVRSTTTTAAIWLAVLMGAAHIGVLGLDLYNDPETGPPHHFDEDMGGPLEQIPFRVDKINREMARIRDEAATRGVTVYNLNPASLCTAFPVSTIEDFLAQERNPQNA